MATNGIKIPNTPAACADLLYTTREKRLKQQKEVDKLHDLETALSNFFIDKLPKGQTGVAGKLALVQVESKAIPQVEDWDAFYKHIKKTGEFELMQRRVSDKAVVERWDDKRTVPGVVRFNAKKVSCTKIKGK